MAHETPSFEKAFERLEQILETMNGGKTPLEESLSLFEEAEKLIRSCSSRLNQAEQKIEMLIKNRNGEAALDANQKPTLQPYQPTAPQAAAQPTYVRQPASPKPAAAPATTLDDLPF